METPSLYQSDSPNVVRIEKPEQFQTEQDQIAASIVDHLSTPELSNDEQEITQKLEDLLSDEYASSSYAAELAAERMVNAEAADKESTLLDQEAAHARNSITGNKADRFKDDEHRRRAERLDSESQQKRNEANHQLALANAADVAKRDVEPREKEIADATLDLTIKVIDRMAAAGELEGDDALEPEVNDEGAIQFTDRQLVVYAEVNKVLMGNVHDRQMARMEAEKGTVRDPRGNITHATPRWDEMDANDLWASQGEYLKAFAAADRAQILFTAYDSVARRALTEIAKDKRVQSVLEFEEGFNADRLFPTPLEVAQSVPPVNKDDLDLTPNNNDLELDFSDLRHLPPEEKSAIIEQRKADRMLTIKRRQEDLKELRRREQERKDEVSRLMALRKQQVDQKQRELNLEKPDRRAQQRMFPELKAYKPIEHESGSMVEKIHENNMKLEEMMLDVELRQRDYRDRLRSITGFKKSDDRERRDILNDAKDAWAQARATFGIEKKSGFKGERQFGGVHRRDYIERLERIQYELGDETSYLRISRSGKQVARVGLLRKVINPQYTIGREVDDRRAQEHWRRPGDDA